MLKINKVHLFGSQYFITVIPCISTLSFHSVTYGLYLYLSISVLLNYQTSILCHLNPPMQTTSLFFLFAPATRDINYLIAIKVIYSNNVFMFKHFYSE